MNKQVLLNAMTFTRANACWWDDPITAEVLSEAALEGYVLRISTAQVEWTHKGCDWINSSDAVQASKIQFNKYNVVDKATGKKAKVWYWLDNRHDGRKCVTICAKEFGHELDSIFPDIATNHTDTMTDYFDKTTVVLFEEHLMYSEARARAIENLSH